MGHTPGKWRVERDGDEYTIVGKPVWPAIRCGKKGEWDVATIDTCGEDDRANAHRIVNCVNACEGIADPSVVPELVEAAENVLVAYAADVLTYEGEGSPFSKSMVEAMKPLIDALGQAQGEQS